MKGQGSKEAFLSRRGSCYAASAVGILVSLACVAVFMGLAAPASADEVLLKNGDRITGEITVLKGGELHVKVPYSGETVKLKWDSIQAVRSDRSQSIRMKDGSEIKGTLEITEDGFMRIISETTDPVVVRDLASVHEMNVPLITYRGNVSAGASYTAGNTDTVSANLDGRFMARSKKQRLTLRGDYNYGETDGEESAKNASGSIKYDFFPLQKLYTYVNSSLKYDRFQDLNLMATVGAGLGYQFLETKRTDLSYEMGVSYVNEDFRPSPGDPDPDRSYAAGRWSLNLDYKVIPDKINLFHFHEGFFGFEDLSNVVIRSRQGLRFTVIKGFFTSLQVNVDFNNAPAADKRKADTALIFGLGYAFDM